MKRLVNKAKEKLTGAKKTASEAKKNKRITNENVVLHRQEALMKGKKFKYPLQYTKHKLILNTLIIGFVVLLASIILFWHQLYKAQSSSDLIYRITRFVPVSVAEVDGEKVHYSDYLRRYRSSTYYVEKTKGEESTNDFVNYNSIDSKPHSEGTQDEAELSNGRMNYLKRKELNTAIEMAYVQKLARENNIIVTDKDIDEAHAQNLKDTGMNEASYVRSLRDAFNLDMDEMRLSLRQQLIRKRVTQKIEVKANRLKDELYKKLKQNESLDDMIQNSGQVFIEAPNTFSLDNSPIGCAKYYVGLTEGGISKPQLSSDGNDYCIVKLVKKDKSKATIVIHRIKLVELQYRLEDLQKQGKIKEYIDVPQIEGLTIGQ